MKQIGGNSIVIKEVNINLVRNTLKKLNQATKQEIAKETGLSAVTVGTMLQHLIQKKEVIEIELAASSGGRPAQRFQYNNEFALALILFPYELEGDIIIRSAVVDLVGNNIYEKNNKVNCINLQVFEDIINKLIQLYPSIGAIGFGLPGVESDGKMIISDYDALIDIPIVKYFKSIYKIPVVLENDVNAAVVGFARRKESKNDSTIVYLYFPDKYPPGSGIFLNGKLYKGKSNFAGEVAVMPLDILWGESLYNSFDEFSLAITKLIVAISSLLNPHEVVLNGSSISETHINKIIENCNIKLNKSSIPDIFLSENFIFDYQNGLISQTLEKLESNISLIIK